MLIIGLTGSIAMGKSKTAKIFEEFGVPVFDSDLYVHDLYDAGGGAIPLFARDKDLKKVVIKDDKNRRYVDRQRLSHQFFKSKKIQEKVEHIVHTLVQYGQRDFIEMAQRKGYNAVVLDIPLLYETGAEDRVDMVCVVTAPKTIQKQRAMRRPGMSEEKFKQILARQMPDAQKRQLADVVINTGLGVKRVRDQVGELVKTLNLPFQHRRKFTDPAQGDELDLFV